ncbi:hypothetical protein [Myroides odoratimimus]|uniref:hypothetical protein n=1 Tax=Myroides odoratimimus TaxID=76832 RepID=UPI003100ECC3
MGIEKKQINSIGLAIFLSANPLSWILPFNSVIVFICLIGLVILLFNNKITNFLNSLLILICYVIVLFFFSMLDVRIEEERLNLYFTSFLVFGITGVLYSQVLIDYRTFFNTILVISILCLPIVYSIDSRNFNSGEEASGFYMGVSYGILRFLLAIIIIVFLTKKTKKTLFLSLVVGFFYIAFYLKYGTRGALLSLLLFLLLLYLLKKDVLNYRVLTLFGFLAFLSLLFFQEGVLFLDGFLNKNDISIEAVSKMAYMINSNIELSNGRETLYNYAFQDISQSPILGLGISSYESRYNIYVHNFLIQGLYEGGLIMLFLFVGVLLLFFKLIVNNRLPKNDKVFLIYVFCSGIIELFFSNVLWRSVFFWYFVCLIFMYRKKVNYGY